MILPTKGLKPEMTLLTLGAEILDQLPHARPVLEVWQRVQAVRRQSNPNRVLSFDWFILALSLLYAASVIDYHEGLLLRGAMQ